MSRCRSCHAPILWAKTDHGGEEKDKWIPLNLEPADPKGTHTFVLRDGDESPVALATPPSVFADETHYLTHFATCPDADEWRRKEGYMSSIPLAEGTTSGEDPDLGRIFDVPRVAVVIDEADPSVLKLAFSGSFELDRSNETQVKFYNELAPGESCELALVVHVAGAQNRHRRDSEGDVDAIVQTKSLVISDVHLERVPT